MQNGRKTILLVAGAGALLFLLTKKGMEYKQILTDFFKIHEGFASKPYWDFKQWSWGYGTRVPGSIADSTKNPGGTISRAKAMVDALLHVEKDRGYLSPLVKVPMSAKQWAALLSFSYNLGSGSGGAKDLIPFINSRDLSALQTQWKKYVYAGGVKRQNLVDRRNAEWDLFVS